MKKTKKKRSTSPTTYLRLIFWVVLFYFFSLFFHQQDLPVSWLEGLCDGLSTSNMVFHCEGLSVGLRHGLQLRGLHVYDTTRRNSLLPFFSAESVSIWPFERRVRVVDGRFPRLGDAYYDGTADYSSGPMAPIRLPDLPSFELELERGEFLGVAPERVNATVKVSSESISFQRIGLDWPDRDYRMHLDGWCAVDFAAQTVKGMVRGEATQAHIRPLLVALDVPVAYPYFDGFTNVEGPVRASCAWDVDITEPGFKIDLDLHPVMGRYNGVSMRKADGGLKLDIHLPNGNFEYDVTVGPIRATDRNSGELDGVVRIRKTNEVYSVSFDANSSLHFKDVLDVMGYFNDGMLDFIVCETPPRFSVDGTYFPYLPYTKGTDLRGRFAVMKGSILGIPLFDASTDWSMRGETLCFSNVVATGSRGGSLFGTAEITIPELDGDRATMSVNLSYGNGSIRELAEIFHFDAGDRHGKAEGVLNLDFPLTTNAVRKLNGSGELRVADGQIMQTKLFAGLTKLLADNVPGIGALVNQSDLACEFEIRDGVVIIPSLHIEGTVFSVVGSGSYDLTTDAIDFTCRLTLMRRENLVGIVLSPVIWPFSKMLMEVKVSGSINEPVWNYIDIIDRIQNK